MRALLLATILGLLAIGTTPAALDLPPVPPLPDEPPAVEAPPAAAPLAGLVPEVVDARPDPSAPPSAALPSAKAVAATTAVGGALALVGLALYSRLSRGQILDNARRDEVFQLVRAQPGVSLTDVAARCGLGWGSTVYHLDRLEKAGFVTSERNGGRRCYFPVGTVARDARPSLGALRQETTRSVADFVLRRPGATQTELAEALAMTPSAASKQISKLESVGLVRREREWKTVRLHPEPKLAELLFPAPHGAPAAGAAMAATA